MKNTYLAIVLFTCFSLNANQVVLGRFLKRNRAHEVKRHIQQEASLSSFVDFEGINPDEHIDTKQLVKWWVPILNNALTQRLFVIYNQFIKWWSSSPKKKMVRG